MRRGGLFDHTIAKPVAASPRHRGHGGGVPAGAGHPAGHGPPADLRLRHGEAVARRGAIGGNSQHIADWYSASHVIHGLLFYFFAWVLWVRWRLFGGVPARYALPIAAAFEAFWEILENSPMIIERYRAVTVSFGYVGDSIVNSLSDIGWMVIGFLLASRLPVWVSVALALALELATLILIRDNLTLNVLMLVWPMDSVRQWQALGG